MSSLFVTLDQFEGPLALLLYLIRKEEMDINDIPIHHITKQYLDHIQMMKKLDLEVASDFITMAATLIHIKSKVLLPQYDEDGEEMPEDPRKELSQKLLEYQRFQDASRGLLDRSILNRDTWRRGYREDLVLEQNQDIEVEDDGLFGLISAYRFMVRAAQKRIHKVMKKSQSIASRILEIRDFLMPGERKIMKELVAEEENAKSKLLVTFLSMLELAKMGFVRLFQSEPYSDIHVETLRVIDRDVIQRVESYEAQDPEKISKEIELTAEELHHRENENVIEGSRESLSLDPLQENFALEEENIEPSSSDLHVEQNKIDSDKEAISSVKENLDLSFKEESATDEDIMNAEMELGLNSDDKDKDISKQDGDFESEL